ncbi:MAG: hypothetical protein KBC08_05430, partial [Caldisericia bacterium]|nr:hypothetical protein [Caldisericia bacterium]
NPIGYKDPSGFSPSCGGRSNLRGSNDTDNFGPGDDPNPVPDGGSLMSLDDAEKLAETWKFINDNNITNAKGEKYTFKEILDLWFQAKAVSVGMQKYKNENYNKNDMKFAFWTCFWNDRAKLGLNTDGCINMANWMKATAYLETHINPKSSSNNDGIMQVEKGTAEILKGLKYFSQKFIDNHTDKNGHWDITDLNAGIYAGIGVWVGCLSAWQGNIDEGCAGIRDLDKWVGSRAIKDEDGNIVGYAAAKHDDERYIRACGTYGPGNRQGKDEDGNPIRTYNTNHSEVQSLKKAGFAFIYGVAIRNLVRQGRSPYSYQNEGAPGDSESPSSLFLP